MPVEFFLSVKVIPFVFAFKRSPAMISISTLNFTTMLIACVFIERVKSGKSAQTALSNISKWLQRKLRNFCNFCYVFSMIRRDSSISKEEQLLSMQTENMHLYSASLQQSRAVFETVSQTGEKFSDLRVEFYFISFPS